mgnify:FL=1
MPVTISDVNAIARTTWRLAMAATVNGKVMKVTAPTFHDEALWRKRGSRWTCISAGPVLHWMVGKPYHEVSRYIERKGWRVIWS